MASRAIGAELDVTDCYTAGSESRDYDYNAMRPWMEHKDGAHATEKIYTRPNYETFVHLYSSDQYYGFASSLSIANP